MQPFQIGETPLTLQAIVEIARQGRKVLLSKAAQERIARSRAVVDSIVQRGDAAPSVYGVNTGFGFLADVRISAAAIAELQRNLIRSHAVGVGQPLPTPVVRAMLFLRAFTLSVGCSGVRPLVAERLCELLNRRIHPIVPGQGSVGASGDLAPLAHLALALLGEGDVRVGWSPTAPGAAPSAERLEPAAAALRDAGLSPIELEAREGLGLVNGTQCMTAMGALALYDAFDACRLADIIGAMSLESLLGTPRAFDPRIHAVRPHPGQVQSAANLRRLLQGSAIVESHRNCSKIQDPYSLRCMPQVHGASRDALGYAHEVLLREMQSATDNPLILEGGPFHVAGESAGEPGYDIVSGGNFHGQPVALALDFAGIAVAELASIAERRIEQLVNPHESSGLPAFLIEHSGLNSGFMMAHVTAAALVSENKILAHPASVDSIPTSAGREDHVSMGVHAGDKLLRIVENVRNVLSIELLCAAQGLYLRAPLEPGPALKAVYEAVRAAIPPLLVDRPLYADIARARTLLDDGSLVAAATAHTPLD
jgi:histidine ammonia-lyase